MAEPLSIVASIAGLVHLSGLIFQSTFKFIKSAKDSPKSAEKLATEVRDLSGILQSLSLLALSQGELSADTDVLTPTFRATQLYLCRQTLLKIKDGVTKAQDDFEKSSKIAKLGRSLKWPFSEEKTNSLLEELNRHKATILLAATAESLGELRKILAGQTLLQSTLSEIKSVVVKRMEVEQRVVVDRTQRKTLEYFLRVNPKPVLDSCLKLRQPLTGLWLTDGNESFLLWKSMVNAKLWLSGITGCGKTILCASVIESVLQETGTKTGLAYFFCKYEDSATHTPANILCSLAAQLAIQKTEAFELLQQSYDGLNPPRGLPRKPDIDELLVLLQGMCGLFDKVFVVVDGVDECGKSAPAVAEALSQLASAAKTANIAVFSRREEEIAATLSDEFDHVDIVAHTDDIQLYVSAEMNRRRELRAVGNRNPGLCQMIHDRLVHGAGAMFRWVACQLDYICNLDSDKARAQALDELPPTLHETYDRILQRVVQDRGRKDAESLVKKSLHWICYAGQSISSRQLCEAVSIRPNATSIDEDDIVEEAAILRRCSSLVRRSVTGDRIELAHFTVKEYLQSIDPESPLAIFRYNKYEAEKSLTETSLRYILFLQFGKKPTLDDAFLRSLSDKNHMYQFYPYAALQWTKASLVQDDEDILRLSRQLFHSDTPCYLNWVIQFLCGIADVRHDINDAYRSVVKRVEELKMSRLHIAASLGRARICEIIMSQDMMYRFSNGAITPLDCALAGPKAIADGIVDQTNTHADPASLSRTLEVLLSRTDGGCVFMLPSGLFTNHSCYSVWALAVCRNLNSPDPFRPFIRHRFSLEESTVQRLHNIILDASTNSEFLHPLFQHILDQEQYCQTSPALREMIQMVQRHLITKGQWDEFEHRGNFATTSLSLAELSAAVVAAVEKNNAGNMKRLLADPRFTYLPDYDFGRPITALQLAVSMGHKEVLEILLGADNAKLGQLDSQGNSLVHYCLLDVHYPCLELLISRGLRTLDRNNSGKTIWHLAASHGSAYILELLLRSEESTEALQMTTPAGRRPLEEALYYGRPQAAVLLLRGGLPPNDFSPGGLPIAHLVARSGSKDLFIAMQGRGLNTDGAAPDGSTPLHHLGNNASPALTRYLKGLYDIRTARQDGRTAVEVLLLSSSKEPPPEQLIQELLPEDHLVSNGAVHIWEFFTSSIIPRYKNWEESGTLEQGLPSAARALITSGVVSSYERLRGQSACVPLFQARHLTISGALPRDFCAVVSAVVNATGLLETLQKYPSTIGLLKDAIRDAQIHEIGLVHMLLDKVHADPSVRENGVSALESLFLGFGPGAKTARFEVFKTVIDSMDPARLNDLLPSGRGLLDHTILTSSPISERLQYTRYLLDKGADPNVTCAEAYKRRPVIVAAAEAESLDMVLLLLEYGANALSRTSDGWDLGKYAARYDDLDALKLLEASYAGATYEWETTCSMVGRTRAGKVLIKGCNVLHVAAFAGSTKAMAYLCKTGVLTDPNSRTADQLTPLHLAAMSGKSAAVKVLVGDLGADVFARAYDGQLPFGLSIECGHPKTTGTLLRLTAGSVTYLELSVHHGALGLCQQIVDQGCPVDSRVASCGGCTPLFVAVRAGRANIARWLLQSGAKTLNVRCPAHPGECSILDVAVLYLPTRHELLRDILSKFLEQKRGTCVPELVNAARTAIYRKQIFALSAILSHIREYTERYIFALDSTKAGRSALGNDTLGCILDLNPPHSGFMTHDEPGTTSASSITPQELPALPLLHLAAQEGFLQAAEMLITYGSDIELPDDSLRTPLAIAAAEGKTDVAKYLLERGAVVDAVDQYGWTPLMLAAARQSLEVVETLEAHGADMYQLDTQGRTLLHLSVAYGNSPSVFHHLMRRGLDPYALDRLGRCAVHIAISRGGGFRSGVWDMGLLLRMPDGPFNVLSDVVFEMEPSALSKLFRFLPRDRAEMLINQRGRGKRSPLCATAITGSVEAFQMLLRLGVDMEVEGSEYGTPLMEAAAHGRLELVKLLVRHGTRTVYVSELGLTRNVFCVCRPHLRVRRWLLVGRFTEQPRLVNPERWSERSVDLTTPLQWSGPSLLQYHLPLEERRRRDESLLEYATRLGKFKKGLASKVIQI